MSTVDTSYMGFFLIVVNSWMVQNLGRTRFLSMSPPFRSRSLVLASKYADTSQNLLVSPWSSKNIFLAGKTWSPALFPKPFWKIAILPLPNRCLWPHQQHFKRSLKTKHCWVREQLASHKQYLMSRAHIITHINQYVLSWWSVHPTCGTIIIAFRRHFVSYSLVKWGGPSNVFRRFFSVILYVKPYKTEPCFENHG